MRNSLVLWLNEYPTLNGGERSFLSVLPGLRASGFQIIAAVPANGALAAALAEQGVPVEPFDCIGPDGTRRPLAQLRERLADVLRKVRPALLHANSLSMGRLSGPVAAKLEVPSIAHLRDIIGLSRQAVADLSCHRRLLAVSIATREHHVVQGLAPERVKVLYNGIDLEKFAPRPPTGWLHQELGIPRERLLIGTIGQIILRKGQDVLAQAAAELAEELPNVHYLIIGARYSQKQEAVEFEQGLHQRFSAAGLAGRVHFLGVREHLEQLLPELSIVVHPARQEPLGRVLLEAAACGRAVIATDVGGTREIFPAQPQSAWLVPANDHRSLTAAIRVLAANGSLRERLGAAARERMVQAFDLRTAAEGLVESYRWCIEKVDG
ncbi:MAG: glycosyltransferase family 4 protein [Planctomycetes bacterium]|nr:glycosyltransferase family 4 protein [Planctomycetota bacterium]